jgi:hypothetical protein
MIQEELPFVEKDRSTTVRNDPKALTKGVRKRKRGEGRKERRSENAGHANPRWRKTPEDNGGKRKGRKNGRRAMDGVNEGGARRRKEGRRVMY